jgi:hypothetical protein
MPAIPAFGRLRKQDYKFEASLSYIGALSLKKSIKIQKIQHA